MNPSPESQLRSAHLPWHYVVDPLLILTAVWCLISFKIFLVKFGEAGLRPDDLLLLLSFTGLLLTRRVSRTPLSLPLRIYLAYIAVECLSTTWNAFHGRVDFLYSLVFDLRTLEYVAFYFVGYSLMRSGFRITKVVTWYFWTLCILIPTQMVGLVPVPGAFARGRASGNTNGPYELAIVAAFLLCYLAYRKRSFLKGFLALVIIILTASRITLVAASLSLLHVGFVRSRSKKRALAIMLPIVALVGGLYFLSATGVVTINAFERIGNSKSYGISDIREMYALTPTASNAQEYIKGPFEHLNGLDSDSYEGDASGLIRFTRWIVLLKSSFAHPDTILLGLGPSFGSAAVDGYFTRTLVETGFVGSITFGAFLISLLGARRGTNWYFREYVVIMVVSALFIDVFLSYKSMMLLLLWHGMNQYRDPATAEACKPRPDPALRD